MSAAARSGADPEALKDWLLELVELAPAERAVRLQALQQTAPEQAAQLAALLPGALATATGLGAAQAWARIAIDASLPGQLGPWRVLREIGRGGMGVVMQGERADGAFEMPVALKVLPPALLGAQGAGRLAAEARVLGRLSHPGIARLVDAGVDQGCAYLAMEYVDGVPMGVYAEREGLDLAGRVRLVLALCAAVQFAHAQLLVHRDIKPANVLVDSTGQVRLLDFGIAKVLGADDAEQTQRLACTPAYASPEQVLGQPVSVAADVFSLGVVLYELLTGQRPFDAGAREGVAVDAGPEAGLATLRAVLEREPAKAPLLRAAVPPDLRAVLFKALEKPLDRRYATVEALAGDLQAFLAQRPVLAQPPSLGYTLRKFVTRHAAAVGGASVALCAVLGSTVWALHSARLADQQRGVAQKRLEAVREIANKVVFDYNEALRPVPGTLTLRKTLVADALSYLDALAVEAAGDRALQSDIAAGFEAVGDVQGRGVTEGNLGDLAGARASYQRAMALRAPLCNTAPPPQALQACGAYARAQVRLGDNTFTQGDTPAAIALFEAALRSAQQALAPRAGPVLAVGTDPALDTLRTQVMDARFEAAQRLAGLSGRQTGAAYARGPALAREQLAAAQALATLQPGPTAQDQLRVANDLLAVRLLAQGQADLALPYLQTSVALARGLVQDQPGRDPQVSLSASLSVLAELQAHRLQAGPARLALAEGLALARQLHEAEPQDRHLLARYANVARRAAQVHLLLGGDADLQANRTTLPQVLKASAVFTPQDGVFYLQHTQLQVELAQTHLAQGDAAAALRTLAAFPTQMPTQARAAVDLAPVWLLRARALAALGRDAEALAVFDPAEAVLRQAVDATPADAHQAARLVQAQRWALSVPAVAVRHAELGPDSAQRLARLQSGQQLTPWWQQALR
jgi:eukaryotic-like serine/threonine-protein kinase